MDDAEFEARLKKYLKENLEIWVDTNSKTGDFGYGDYRNYQNHVIRIMLGNEEITKTEFSTGGD